MKFGPLDATWNGTVEWAGPSTLKVGRTSSLTIRNNTNRAETLQAVKETTTLKDKGALGGIIELGSNFQVTGTNLGLASIHTIGPGTSKTWSGKEWTDKKAFAEDIKYQERWYITYVSPPPVDNSIAVTHDSFESDDSYLDVGPDYTIPDEGAGSIDANVGGGKSSITIVLLIIALLVGLGGGWAIKGAMIRRMLGG